MALCSCDLFSRGHCRFVDGRIGNRDQEKDISNLCICHPGVLCIWLRNGFGKRVGSLCKDQLAGNVNRILFQFLGFLCAYIFNISAVDASVTQDVGITRSELFRVLYRCNSEQISSCCKSRFDQFSATDRALIVHVITSSLL